MDRCKLLQMSQANVLRQALAKQTIKPTIHVSMVDDAMLQAVGKLTAEFGKIGSNLNQIAKVLNANGTFDSALAQSLRDAAADLAALKFKVLKEVGDVVGHTETYQLEKR